MRVTPFVCYCLILSLSVAACPQSPSPDGADARQKQVLQEDQAGKTRLAVQKCGTGERARVRVTLQDKTEVKGYISQIDADSFQVTNRKSGASTTIAYQDVRRIHGGGMSKGTKIAIVVAVAAGVVALESVAVLSRSGE